VLTAIVGLGLRPPSGRPFQAASSPLRDAGRLFGPRGLGLFLLGAFLTWVGMSAVLTFTPIRFAELGAGASIVGLGGAIAAGTEVPLMLRFPSLAKRWGSNRLLIAGSAFTAARAIVAAFSTDANVLLAASLFGGLGYAFFAIGGITYVSEHVPRELAATAQGIFQGVGNSLAQVTAAALGGAVAAFAGVAGLFAIAAVVGVAAAAILWLAVRRGVGGDPDAGRRRRDDPRARDPTWSNAAGADTLAAT
jgi:MFS family permease